MGLHFSVSKFFCPRFFCSAAAWLRFVSRGLSLLAALLATAAPAHAGSKRLIEFGWDIPDTAFLRAHISQMRQTPFDGCVFQVEYAKPDGAKGNFTWQAWGRRAFTEAELHDAFTDLRHTRFGKFKYNFLRLNTTPAHLDWFDDHSAVLANATLAAQLARAGRCPGILFDIEQYDGKLFNYHQQRDAATKPWAVYAAQARLRGREVMQALQAGYPALTVFLTFGYSLPWGDSNNAKATLADCNYGLLAPFLDGMLEAARGGTRFVDGFEHAYAYTTAAEFAAAQQMVKHDLLPIVCDPAKYHRVFSLGFGLWLDYNSNKRPWDAADVSKNYFSPTAFETTARAALRATDQYVWIYSQTPRWWSAAGQPVKLPSEYGAALREARRR